MDADAERTLKNLHVIAVLSHNDKLMTNDDDFSIYAPTSLRGVFRAWYGERRLQNVTRIRQQVQNAIKFAVKSLDDATALYERRGEGLQMLLRVETIVTHHLRMMNALGEARAGLGNLATTYRDDAALTSQLHLVQQEVSDFIQVVTPHSQRLREQAPKAVQTVSLLGCDGTVASGES